MSNTRRIARAAAALALALACSLGTAHAVLIVDTGEPYMPGIGNALSGSGDGRFHQFVAGMFTLSDSYAISSVAPHLQYYAPTWASAGTFNFKLYDNSSGLPGNLLYASSMLTLAADAAGAWHTAEGLNWVVGPGTYWLSIEAAQSSIGVIASAAGKSLGKFAFDAGFDAPGSWESIPGATPSIRIDAIAAVPEPATFGMLALGLAALGLRRSQHRRQKV